ncbi:uncharacterized protein B0H18DRAFT_1103844 [Fomitopsis serialis]|uniref:uncharacterized protein n=1 Tax=Fomitopsis serialis TaxID=139415 RepID=UPI0020080109|nr:uncharacterized protein B0H18DRAFT_1103844 [Neoantrodia serialis]KAH9928383.1 hypothetical protein B0H18DRAFT_1103844 [Neoantrodia serialis]
MKSPANADGIFIPVTEKTEGPAEEWEKTHSRVTHQGNVRRGWVKDNKEVSRRLAVSPAHARPVSDGTPGQLGDVRTFGPASSGDDGAACWTFAPCEIPFRAGVASMSTLEAAAQCAGLRVRGCEDGGASTGGVCALPPRFPPTHARPTQGSGAHGCPGACSPHAIPGVSGNPNWGACRHRRSIGSGICSARVMRPIAPYRPFRRACPSTAPTCSAPDLASPATARRHPPPPAVTDCYHVLWSERHRRHSDSPAATRGCTIPETPRAVLEDVAGHMNADASTRWYKPHDPGERVLDIARNRWLPEIPRARRSGEIADFGVTAGQTLQPRSPGLAGDFVDRNRLASACILPPHRSSVGSSVGSRIRTNPPETYHICGHGRFARRDGAFSSHALTGCFFFMTIDSTSVSRTRSRFERPALRS